MSRTGVKVLLTTGRTLKQGRAMESGKTSSTYMQETAYCEVDSTTLDVLGIEAGTSITVETIYGLVVVRCILNKNAVPGVAFMPCGPYANSVVGVDTVHSGMPNFKNIEALLFPTPDKSPLMPEELLRRMLEDR